MADSNLYVPTQYGGRFNQHEDLWAAAATSYPKGTLVGRDANGRAVRPGAGIAIHGVSEGDNDNSAGADDAFLVPLALGVHRIAYTGTAPKTHEILYAVDNQTVSLDSSTNTRGVAGVAVKAETGFVWILIDPVINGILQRLLPAVYLLENVGANGTVIKSDGTVAAWAADAT